MMMSQAHPHPLPNMSTPTAEHVHTHCRTHHYLWPSFTAICVIKCGLVTKRVSKLQVVISEKEGVRHITAYGLWG